MEHRSEIKLENVRANAVGKTLSQEEMNRFSAGREEEKMIPTRHGETHVFVYYPQEQKENYPVMVNLHGGGFVKGHRDQDVVYCRNMCQNSGYVIIDVDYHTAPEYRYPYAVEECYDVIKYVAEHPEEFMADINVLVVGGHSAGGNLTCGVEFLALESKAFKPTQLILDYPPMDFTAPVNERRFAYAPFIRIPVEQEEQYLEWYIDKNRRKELTASPVYATKEEIENFPPVLMILAEEDALSYDAEKFAFKLIDAGVTVYAKKVKGSGHGFTVRRTRGFEIAEEMIFEVLEKQKRLGRG